MKRAKLQSPTGFHDILPEDQRYFRKIYHLVESLADFWGFKQIETPILEFSELFTKGVGMLTDIIEKQMYILRTKGSDLLALRPEGTASVVRAYLEHGMHNLPQPVKLWYFGPFFRYESPQAGRYRQFHQFGFEVLGAKDPVIDSQIIQIAYNILKELHFKDLTIEINSIGDHQCRPYYKKILTNYLRNRESSLCPDCKRRLRENPLRALDCKQEKCQPIKAQAPQIIDHLCEECHHHFKEVLEFLDEIELPYNLSPYLVRGLDYYTKTVFEISENSEEGKRQGALIGGGRYDNLAKILGGRVVPGCGLAGGVERIVNLLKGKGLKAPLAPPPKIFLAQLGFLAKRKSLKLLEEFRKAKILVAEALDRESLKIQLSRAAKLGVKYTLIFGQKEALEGVIIIRDMISGKQETVRLDKVIGEIKRRLKK